MLHWFVPLLSALTADSLPTISAREMWTACRAVSAPSRTRSSEDSVVNLFCLAPGSTAWRNTEVPSAAIIRRIAGTSGRARTTLSVPHPFAGLAEMVSRTSGRLESLARDPQLLNQVVLALDSSAGELLTKTVNDSTAGTMLDSGVRNALISLRAALKHPANKGNMIAALNRVDSVLSVKSFSPAPPPPMMAAAGPALAALTPIGMESRLLWSVSDAVLSRSKEQFNSFLLFRAVRLICGPPPRELTPYLKESCASLEPELLQEAPLNLALLRAAMARDLETLPGAILTQQIRLHGAKLSPSQSSTAFLLASIVQLYSDVTAGANPQVSLLRVREFATSMPKWKAGASVSPLARHTYQLSALLATVVDTTGNTLVTWTGVADSLKYPVLALAVNAKHDPHWPGVDDPTERITPRFDAGEMLNLFSRGKESVALLQHAQRSYAHAAMALSRLSEADTAASTKAFGVAADSVVGAIIGVVHSLGGNPDPKIQRLAQVSARLAVNARLRNYSMIWHDMIELRRLGGSESVALRFSPQSLRVLTFATAAMQAKTGTEMDAAVANFVAPGDAYLRKRAKTRDRTLTLNAYGGGQTGVEVVEGDRAMFAAPYLPVGAEFGFGRPHGGLLSPLNHVNLFVQLIDLGALASWRLSAGKTEQQPSASVAQVFAPGAYLVFPLKTWPLTIGAGWSWSPKLRKMDANGQLGEQDRRNAQRLPGIFVAFDIPLM